MKLILFIRGLWLRPYFSVRRFVSETIHTAEMYDMYKALPEVIREMKASRADLPRGCKAPSLLIDLGQRLGAKAGEASVIQKPGGYCKDVAYGEKPTVVH
ncbi:MAG: hypothetical protein R8L07_11030 [Alphaproteobacteria bacterium]|nr:hypothetical protein [Alphaproteobacteria bacterium]